MQTIYFQKTAELKRNLKILQKKLKVKLNLKGKRLTLEGESLDEYEAEIVLNAINFGFSAEKALELKNTDIVFQVLHIKDISRKKNLKSVRARIIGKKGQTLNTLKEISGASIMLKDNEVGIIGDAESIRTTTTAITNLIRGTKQSNVYKFLEKQNTKQKQIK